MSVTQSCGKLCKSRSLGSYTFEDASAAYQILLTVGALTFGFAMTFASSSADSTDFERMDRFSYAYQLLPESCFEGEINYHYWGSRLPSHDIQTACAFEPFNTTVPWNSAWNISCCFLDETFTIRNPSYQLTWNTISYQGDIQRLAYGLVPSFTRPSSMFLHFTYHAVVVNLAVCGGGLFGFMSLLGSQAQENKIALERWLLIGRPLLIYLIVLWLYGIVIFMFSFYYLVSAKYPLATHFWWNPNGIGFNSDFGVDGLDTSELRLFDPARFGLALEVVGWQNFAYLVWFIVPTLLLVTMTYIISTCPACIPRCCRPTSLDSPAVHAWSEELAVIAMDNKKYDFADTALANDKNSTSLPLKTLQQLVQVSQEQLNGQQKQLALLKRLLKQSETNGVSP